MAGTRAALEITIVNVVRSDPPAVPAGPLSLCAALEARGYTVAFADYQAWDGPGLGDPSAFASWLARSGPILGLSVYSSSLPLVLAATPLLKASRPDRLVVIGGPGTTGVEARLLERFPAIDLVVHGEGEDTLVEIVAAWRDSRHWSGVAGLSFREDGIVRTTPPRPPIRPIDRLPAPAYHLADLTPYRQESRRGSTPFGVFLARGCPFRCAFCAIPEIWHGEVRARDLDKVVDEIRTLGEQHGADSFRILDDTFTVDRRRVEGFCERLAASGMNLPWLCHARIDTVDERLLQSMKGAGCRLVFYGVESGSDAVLRRLGKTFTVRQALDVIEMSRRHLDVETSFMWGFPFESLDDLYDTVVALLAARDMGARTKLSWLVPFPATAIVREHAALVGRRFRHDVFPARSHLDAYPYGPDLVDVIRANADILPSFFFLDGPGHDEKMAYLRQWTADSLMHGNGADRGTAPTSTNTERRACADATDLPAIRRGCSLRTVGGRRFVFDAERPGAFRISPFAEQVFLACERRTSADDLVADLARQHARARDEVRTAVGRVIDRFDTEGLLAVEPLPSR